MSFPFTALLNSPMINELALLGELYNKAMSVGPSVDEELMHPHPHVLAMPFGSGYLRPWRTTSAGDSGMSHLENDAEGLKIRLDVQQFKPEELKVKVVDEFLVVDAKHDERLDRHGWVSRQFTRRYKIPDGVDAGALTSKLSSDGILSLHAPKKMEKKDESVREIPIIHTNKPALEESKNLFVDPPQTTEDK